MSLKCSKVIEFMNEFAPPKLAEDWDNIGLLVGNEEAEINKILIALDATDAVIDEAIEKGCNMIITHHPLIFKAVGNINSSTALGRRIMKLIKNDIALFSAHTNLDITKNGTNDTLAKLLGLKEIDNLCEPVFDNLGLGKVGVLEKEETFEEFIKAVKASLNLEHLVVSGDKSTKIKKVGLGTGKCSDYEYITLAKQKNCDVYITGDIAYHNAQYANDLNLCLIDATHYFSEVLIVPVIFDYLSSLSKDFVCVKSEVNSQSLEIV